MEKEHGVKFEPISLLSERKKRIAGFALDKAYENVYPESVYEAVESLYKEGTYYTNSVPSEESLRQMYSRAGQWGKRFLNYSVPEHVSDLLQSSRLLAIAKLEYPVGSRFILPPTLVQEIDDSLHGRFPRVSTENNWLKISYVVSDRSSMVCDDLLIYSERMKNLLHADNYSSYTIPFRAASPQLVPAKHWHPYDFMQLW